MLPLIAQTDFLEGITANDLMLDTIETPSDSIVQAIEGSGFEFWFGPTQVVAFSPDSALQAEVRVTALLEK
jgi:hypothetical protein